jgi:hypothetical protein
MPRNNPGGVELFEGYILCCWTLLLKSCLKASVFERSVLAGKCVMRLLMSMREFEFGGEIAKERDSFPLNS